MNWSYLAWMVAAGLATTLGGLALLVIRSPTDRLLDTLLGFTAGVMLAATCFSLLVPALDEGTVSEVVLGFAVGGAVLALLDYVLPHVHARFTERRFASRDRQRGVLLLSALTIHNVPEGIAVGVAFAAGGADLGVPVALAIGIQNIPEGFAAAAPLLQAGVRSRTAVGFAAATGAVEPPAALLAFGVAEAAGALLPFALAFAAGAMLYVIADELIPESHAHGFERAATFALLFGFAVMLVLDNVFG